MKAKDCWILSAPDYTNGEEDYYLEQLPDGTVNIYIFSSCSSTMKGYLCTARYYRNRKEAVKWLKSHRTNVVEYTIPFN